VNTPRPERKPATSWMTNADGRRDFGIGRVMRELTAAKTALKTVLAKRGTIDRIGLTTLNLRGTAFLKRTEVREPDVPAPAREVQELDVMGSLRDTENALRDFIGAVLSARFGRDWIERSGVTPDRVQKWTERKASEPRRFAASGILEERLLYYADFHDLKTILQTNWSGPFSDALGDWKTTEVWLEELERMRDPDAHRRELLPHQKHLAIGIAGELRTRLVRYRSKRETTADCFPRIESVRDSLGNLWTASDPSADLRQLDTKAAVRPGDQIFFLITARDPEDGALEYRLSRGPSETWNWTAWATLSYTFTEQDIADNVGVELMVRSKRPHHAKKVFDDAVTFGYRVLPPRRSL